ncbi:hypothetical protein B0H17DRAFT_1180761 [Mycena rosella]|uniref:C2H2-type domain-containing protein n=1 Tax=Mycena rosella TaxID=1033263 RepID=A0AAD7DBG8_MYCRO|nr:hypothetical protein B0H17DRAFT_1180761 [Mycena rosella]
MSVLDLLPFLNIDIEVDLEYDAPSPVVDDPVILAALAACSIDLSKLALLPPHDIAQPDASTTYAVPRDHLMHHDDSDGAVGEWVHRPKPTTPYSMGLSFEHSGWRAPEWRAPECREIESGCIDPALLMKEPEAGLVHALDDDDVSESEDDDDIGSEFENPQKLLPRVVRPLPPSRRVSTHSRTGSCTAPPPSPPSTAAPASPPARSASAPRSKKRKAPHAAGPSSTKKAAVECSTSPLPHAVPANYQPLLANGCTVIGDRRMRCNINQCSHTGSFADMSRHMLVHFPKPLLCQGCPESFARKDALERHLQKKGSGHVNPARRAFSREEIAQVHNKKQRRLREALVEKFEELFAESTA